jgi:hypothetical protein
MACVASPPLFAPVSKATMCKRDTRNNFVVISVVARDETIWRQWRDREIE